MDFFEHQDAARKRTGLLVVLMALAVLVIIVLVFGLVCGAYLYLVNQSSSSGGSYPGPGGYSPTVSDLPFLQLFGATSIGVLAVVLGGSLFKTAQLAGSGGGARVASALGGRPLQGDSTDADERKLLNVVEEMSIASGSPVPEVYLLDDEDGINAFAAGWSPESAVIGVTRGSVRQLSRDELQGVIAHEFSHILNGDMRINIRLIGIIFGILAISLIGSILMRVMYYSGAGRSSGARRGKNQDGKAAIVIFIAGIALYIIGYAGVFFGRLIQAAVSRQREYLADASAVQFTRNPEGIGGALQRIGASSASGGRGAKLNTAHASEHSHLFFGEAVSSFLGRALATHPPLDERIKQVLPSWDGMYPEPRQLGDEVDEPPARPRKRQGFGRGGGMRLPGTDALPGVLLPGGLLPGAAFAGQAIAASALDQIGKPTPEHLAHAEALVEALPNVLRTAARTGAGAQAVALALLLDRDDEAVRHDQLGHLNANAPGTVSALVHQLVGPATTLDAAARLPLLDLTLPALARLSAEEFPVFRGNLEALIRADQKLDLFEWAMQAVIERHLARRFGTGQPDRVKHQRIGAVRVEAQCLLSMLAYVGSRDADAAREALKQAVAKLGKPLELLPRERVSYQDLDAAVRELAGLTPLGKRRVIEACAACISADGEVTVREGELMRVVAEVLGVPMPPLLAGQRLA